MCFVFDELGLSTFTRILLACFVFFQCAIWTAFSTRLSILHVVIVDTESLIDLGAKGSIIVNPV
jgi:hypothetical protein